jgi:hypothetical protein
MLLKGRTTQKDIARELALTPGESYNRVAAACRTDDGVAQWVGSAQLGGREA